MAISDTIESLKEHIGNAYTAIGNKNGAVPKNKNCKNLQASIESIFTGTDTDDATAVASDILNGETAYSKGVKLTGTIETYDGTYIEIPTAWKATVTNLGSEDPASVVFDVPDDTVEKPWSEVTYNGDTFIKFNKMYKKVNTVADNQITSFTVADKKLDSGYQIYPCFLDESGNELDYILVGKYMSDSSTTCNSTSTSYLSQTISNGRAKARERGNGYQLMDWRILRLWQDLIICVMGTVNTNNGSGLASDNIGLYWGDADQWIDGVCHNSATWIYSNSPSKYVDSPTATTDGYATLSGYTAPTSDDVEIKKLGYDSTQPFFNYPSETVSNSSYNTYYCDAYWYSSGNKPVIASVGDSSSDYGAFGFEGSYNWSGLFAVRLCYRPISS